jgi:hypothetical protein
MEWIWNSKGSQEVPKIRFLECLIWQMVAQGNILVLGKTSYFFAWLSIFNVLSIFYMIFVPLVFTTWSWSIQTVHCHNLWPQAHGKKGPWLNEIGAIYSPLKTWDLGDLFFLRVQAQGWYSSKQIMGTIIWRKGGPQKSSLSMQIWTLILVFNLFILLLLHYIIIHWILKMMRYLIWCFP